MLGYGFEPGIVDAMLDALDVTPGALPLLQFTAAKLWELRDRQRRIITHASYLATGGVAGALATHADEIYAGFAASDQKLVRAVFQRLVTPERTRAIVDASELRDISVDVDRVIARLVEARLLVVQVRGDGERAVELVHESLITRWPLLLRWLDENHEDAAYLAQLRAAAKQWDHKGRPQGLLWRGEAMEEARVWRARYRGELPSREGAYLDAVFRLAARGRRRAFVALVATIAILLVIVGIVAFFNIEAREAKEIAVHDEQRANEAAQNAKLAEQRALANKLEAEQQRELAEAREKDAKAALEQFTQEHERWLKSDAGRKTAERVAAENQAKARTEQRHAKDEQEKRKHADENARKELEDNKRKQLTNDLPK